MDLRKIPLFRAMSERMAWLTERQHVLAHNVANANTPGFRPSELKKLDFGRMVAEEARGVQLAATNVKHIAPPRPPTRFEAFEEPDSGDALPGGNAVVLEEQLMKVTDNAMQYQLTTSLYRKHLAMIRAALGSPGR